MRFEQLNVQGVTRVRLEPHADERGFFARTFCIDEFAAQGLPTAAVQMSMSHNKWRGTVRGLHFQWPPSQESKLVRCLRGALFDVVLDLRPQSPSYLQHVGVVLDDQNRDALFIPPGCAHGFQTLADGTEVLYQMTDRYAPDLYGGLRWNDPAFGIEWPIPDSRIMADRDASYPDFDRTRFESELARRRS